MGNFNGRLRKMSNYPSSRHLISDNDSLLLKYWIKSKIGSLGVTFKYFCEQTGIPYNSFIQIGFYNPQARSRSTLSINEVKIVAKAFNIPALYILIAFNYPAFDDEMLPDANGKAVVEQIREEAKTLMDIFHRPKWRMKED